MVAPVVLGGGGEAGGGAVFEVGAAVSAKFWVTIAPLATLAVAVEELKPAAEAPS